MSHTYDWVIREASLYDGTGAPPVIADIAIEGGRIAEVGAAGGTARASLDGRGLALSPGFIDVHTHDDFAAVLHPQMEFKLCGGVTTCVVGNCGMGAAPFAEASVMARAFHPHAVLPEWRGYAGYLAQLDAAPPAVNVGVLIGHGTARMAAMGQEVRAPEAKEMARMKAIITEGLEAGALGLSSGLIYDPGRFAGTDELVELASLMRGTGALYATHMRDESTGLLESVNEAIAIGERAGVPVQISHHKASGRSAWGLVRESLQLIERAQARGLGVHADQYPYTAGSTILSAVFRDGKFGGGIGELSAGDVVIASSAARPEWEGKTVVELALAMGCEPEAAATRILAEEPGATVVLHVMSEDDVRTVMRHRSTMIGSDGIPTLEGKPHPRLYGTFARVLGRYARDLGLFPLAEAIYRMTGFPAAKFALEGRGVVKPGAHADLVLFDPERIIDRGTFADPHRAPDGIVSVFVNGVKAVEQGRATGLRPGRALRRATARS
ncbi:MAG: D-aminoacylase [Betaproteobacteria bacterium]|nr:D-aminoacylase [Betaproteobacteria bacterium]